MLLRALEERQLIDSQRGQIAIGWLIVEDLVMVLTLVLLPAVAGIMEQGDVGFATLAVDMGITIGKVIAFIAIFLAADPNSNVFKIVSFAWAGFGATFGPAVLFALFWRRSNRQGVLAGLVAGGLMIFAWKFCVRPLGGIWDIYELMPAFVVNCIVLVVVSLATPAPDKSITDVFDKVRD